jgi:hypothetical protein
LPPTNDNKNVLKDEQLGNPELPKNSILVHVLAGLKTTN